MSTTFPSPYSTPQPRRRRRWPWLVAIGLVVLVFIGYATDNSPDAPAAPEVTVAEAFTPLGEWHTFTNGTKARAAMAEVTDAETIGNKSIPRALRLTVEIENPTPNTIGNAHSGVVQFADLPGQMALQLGTTGDQDAPELIRPGKTATIVQTYVPHGGAEWPADAEFIAYVRTPLFLDQAPATLVDETRGWLGAPTANTHAS